jgi:hypothetical protein
MKEKTASGGTMRRLDKRARVDRRGFLRGGGLAAVGVAVVPAGTLTLLPVTVFAQQQFPTLGADTGKTLIRMARDIFPHDRISARYYAQAVAPYDAKAAQDPALRKLIQEGVAMLDANAKRRYDKPYAQVPTEPERVVLLKEI